ncbi:BatD family protein [Kangiella sp.]|uniref:BatD family protein n=1 Tax=Kangiella sp. TaxID=1920245 RepID=UPI003A8D77DE
MIRQISLYCFLAISLMFAQALEAKVEYSLDRGEIRENETFRLKIVVQSPSTLANALRLDFLPEELERLSLQQFNNSTMVNGQFQSEMGWEVKLLARQAGTYTVPATKFGNETAGSYTIRVLPAIDELKDDDSPAKVKLRAALNLEDVYVQQQLILTVRIYRSVVTRHESLTLPKATGALLEQLGDDRTFEMVQGNTSYRVVERQFALFPQQSGELVIEPMTYTATILDDSQSSNPWGLSRTKPISLSTPQYKVNVKHKPAEAEEPWLPATNLKIEANWQPSNQTFEVGAPATLEFKVKGTGLLQTQLPSITFPEMDGVKIYRDSPEYQQLFNRLGVTSHHIEKLAIVPSKPGLVTIPELRTPWWNTVTDKQDYAVLPAMTIEVKPQALSGQATSTEPVVSKNQENESAISHSASEASTSDTSEQGNVTIWQVISIVLAALWLLTLILWRFTKPKPMASNTTDPSIPLSQTEQMFKSSLSEVEKACNNNQSKLAHQLLLQWCRNQSHLKHIRNLNQLKQVVEYTQLSEQLEKLQEALYSTHSEQVWQGQALATALQYLPKPESHHNEQGLPKLYS